jgi:hypothetical protein
MDLRIPTVLGGAHRDLMGKIKRSHLLQAKTCYKQRLFKIFAYNAQRFRMLLMDQYLLLFGCLFETTL